MTDSTPNTQPLTHMTDIVTPQPTAKDHLTNAQGSLIEVHNATVKLMRDVEEAKAKLPSDTPVVSDEIMRKLVGYVWSRAIEYSQDYADESLNKEVSISVQIDEDINGGYNNLDVRVRGEVEQDVVPSEVGIDFEIPTIPDANDLDEILKEFHERQKAAETAIHINLTKDNA